MIKLSSFLLSIMNWVRMDWKKSFCSYRLLVWNMGKIDCWNIKSNFWLWRNNRRFSVRYFWLILVNTKSQLSLLESNIRLIRVEIITYLYILLKVSLKLNISKVFYIFQDITDHYIKQACNFTSICVLQNQFCWPNHNY